MTNKLDQIYRSIRLTKYFIKGWGKPENLKRLCEFRKSVASREACYKLVSPDYPVKLGKEQEEKDCIIIDGSFFAPLAHYLPEVVPDPCKTAYFQFVLPKRWADENFKPIIIHIAGTGDQFCEQCVLRPDVKSIYHDNIHYFWRRRNLIAKPLIKEGGIGSIILENPFYGLRKPVEQKRSILHNVSDIFVMGGCLMLEALVLFHLCERLGFGPLGTTGLSMGGHMASIAATTWPKPLVIVPCLSGLTASHVFTQGAISHALNWKMLEEQYISNDCLKNEVQKMVKIIEGDAFKAGQQFAKHLARKSSKSSNSKDGCSIDVTNITYKDVTTPLSSINSNKAIVLADINEAATESHLKNKYENCDNYCNLKTDSTIKNDVTAALLLNKLNLSKNELPQSLACGDNAQNKDEFVKPETMNKLMNLIVRLTRASINFNILAGKTKDSLEELKQPDITAGEQQAFHFMNGIMDECTHLKNYPIPVDPSMTIAVCADNDGYVPDKGMSNLTSVWPGAEVRYVKGGHVRAYVQYQKEFRYAIIDAFKRYRVKYLTKTCKV